MEVNCVICILALCLKRPGTEHLHFQETQITFGQRRRETQQEKTAMRFGETFLLNIIFERGEIE